MTIRRTGPCALACLALASGAWSRTQAARQHARSAQQLYVQAIHRLVGAAHFRIAGTFYYSDDKTKVSFEASWQKPERWSYGTGSKPAEITVGRTTCDDDPPTWICFRQTPPLRVADLVDRGILLPRGQSGLVGSRPPAVASLQQLRFSSALHGSQEMITIHGSGDPWASVPGCQGCVHRSNPNLSHFAGVLILTPSSGLPVSLNSTVTFFGRRMRRQVIRFDYAARVTISLPRGHAVRCPSWAAPGARCFSDRADAHAE